MARRVGNVRDAVRRTSRAAAVPTLFQYTSKVDKYVPSLGGPNAVLKVSISSPVLPDVVEADMILMLVEER